MSFVKTLFGGGRQQRPAPPPKPEEKRDKEAQQEFGISSLARNPLNVFTRRPTGFFRGNKLG